MFVRKIGVIAVAACVAVVSTVPISAEEQQTSPSEPSSMAAAKQPTPRQQKMKECAAKWKQEKADKHVSGRDAYHAFMKECLKS